MFACKHDKRKREERTNGEWQDETVKITSWHKAQETQNEKEREIRP